MRNISTFFYGVLFSILPLVSSAQEGDKDTVQGYLVLITNFIGDTLLPLLFAIALLFFLVNVARYFIVGGNDSESQEKAKTLALYGIGAFVFLVSIWGIVNMFVSAFEIDDTEANCPDYLGDWCGSSGNYGSSGGGYQRFDSYYGDFSNDPENATIEEFEDGSQIQNVPIYDQYGNVVNRAEIEVTSDDEDVSEPEEEAGAHSEDYVTPTKEESAPVNIGDTTIPEGCVGAPGEMICDN
jgi:hypothetical protein